jgi:hypothetical protein
VIIYGKESAMQKAPSKKNSKGKISTETPNFTKPVWGELEMSCEDCKYNDQDIDTFPCAKCHTRH